MTTEGLVTVEDLMLLLMADDGASMNGPRVIPVAAGPIPDRQLQGVFRSTRWPAPDEEAEAQLSARGRRCSGRRGRRRGPRTAAAVPVTSAAAAISVSIVTR